MPDQRTAADWWANTSDRERTGVLIAAGGTIMAAAGMLLLPWVEASSQRAGAARRSLRDVMIELRDSDGFSAIESILFNQPWLPFLLGPFVLMFVIAAFKPNSDKDTSLGDAVIAPIAGVVYSGWIVVVLNREINSGQEAAWALGIDVRVGLGAWMTIAGYVALTFGVLYGAKSASNATV